MVVPFNQSERLAAALKRAKVECYFVTVDGAGHGGFRNPELRNRERQFFDKCLCGAKTTISEEAIPNAAPKKTSMAFHTPWPLSKGCAMRTFHSDAIGS